MALPTPNQTPFGMDEKTTCTVTWAASIFFPFVAPLIVFLVCPNNPWVRRQAAMCLTLHGLAVVGGIICALLALVVIGIFLAPILGIAVLVACIIGAVESSNGREFNPPFVTDICRSIFKV
ncbi:MAG: DUF4870 domain-containing protein [Armatimonadota bacterium]